MCLIVTCMTVIPDPPVLTLAFFSERNVFEYNWIPPKNVTGDIQGYNLTYSGDCGRCFPLELVSKDTTTATCTEYIALGQTCRFEVRTVTADCGFESEPANVIFILDSKFV